MTGRITTIGAVALLLVVAAACQPAPPPPPVPPARVTLTATLERDVAMGLHITEPRLRGLPGCDARIIERQIRTEHVEVTGWERRWNYTSQHILRAGSEWVFSVPNKPDCVGYDYSVNYDGRVGAARQWWLDVPTYNGVGETLRTVSFDDGFRIAK